MSYDALVATLMAPSTLLRGNRRREVNAETANVRVLIDASCDLPTDFCERYDIPVIPLQLQLGRMDLIDTRNVKETSQVYHAGWISANAQAKMFAPPMTEIRDQIVRNIGDATTQAVVIAPSSALRDGFVNAVQAAQGVGVTINRVRKLREDSLPFAVSVIDSGSLYAGLGLLAFDAVARSRHGLFGEPLAKHLEAMGSIIQTFLVVDDLHFVQTRDSRLNDCANDWLTRTAATWLGYRPIIRIKRGKGFRLERVRGYEQAVATILGFAGLAIVKGLKTPAVVVSYAGELAELTETLAYKTLAQTAASNRVRLLASPMSVAEAGHVGKRAVSVAFASTAFKPG
jgi:DegV family protein with EDD domain